LGVSAKSACALRMLTTFPSSASRGHLLSSVRSLARERAPHRRDGPTKTHVAPKAREGCRHPVNQGAFHRCDDEHAKGSLHSLPVSAPSLTPPTRFPMAGDKCFGWALQAPLAGLAARDVVFRLRECRTPFLPADAPGTDDPSAPTWLGLRGLSRGLIAFAVPTPTAAPRRLLRPRARGSSRGGACNAHPKHIVPSHGGNVWAA